MFGQPSKNTLHSDSIFVQTSESDFVSYVDDTRTHSSEHTSFFLMCCYMYHTTTFNTWPWVTSFRKTFVPNKMLEGVNIHVHVPVLADAENNLLS